MTASAALQDIAADAIPGLEKRYRKHLTPTPKKMPAVRGSFKATLWFTAAEYVEMMSQSAALKNGKMSLGRRRSS